jgi:hypothetical protein
VADRTLKLVWEDTNEIVSTNGHAWSGIAAKAGAVIAIFDTTGSWSRISPDNLVVAGAPPVDPPPVDPPPVQPPPVNPPPVDPGVPPQAIVDAVFAPPINTTIISAPGLFKPTSGDDGLHFNFNGGRYTSGNNDGATPAFRFRSAGGGNIRQVTIDNLTLYGNGYGQAGCGNGIEMLATGGAILLFKLTNMRASWCGQNGFLFKGDLFEGSTYDLVAKDNALSGALFDNNPGVVSNFMMYGTNLSRNRSHGLHTINGVQSIDMFGGSFVNNDVGGVNGAIRSAYGVNGENTGEVLFDLGFLPYACRIVGCNLSSNGSWTNPANPLSKVSQYLIRTQSRDKLQEVGSYVTPYGTPIAMAVIAP